MRGTLLWVFTDAVVALYLFSCPHTSFVQHVVTVVVHCEDAPERGSGMPLLCRTFVSMG
jgi:hypothetical protein